MNLCRLRTTQPSPTWPLAPVSQICGLCLIGLHLAAGLAAATAIFIQQQTQFISLETEGWGSGEEEA